MRCVDLTQVVDRLSCDEAQRAFFSITTGVSPVTAKAFLSVMKLGMSLTRRMPVQSIGTWLRNAKEAATSYGLTLEQAMRKVNPLRRKFIIDSDSTVDGMLGDDMGEIFLSEKENDDHEEGRGERDEGGEATSSSTSAPTSERTAGAASSSEAFEETRERPAHFLASVKLLISAYIQCASDDLLNEFEIIIVAAVTQLNEGSRMSYFQLCTIQGSLKKALMASARVDGDPDDEGRRVRLKTRNQLSTMARNSSEGIGSFIGRVKLAKAVLDRLPHSIEDARRGGDSEWIALEVMVCSLSDEEALHFRDNDASQEFEKFCAFAANAAAGLVTNFPTAQSYKAVMFEVNLATKSDGSGSGGGGGDGGGGGGGSGTCSDSGSGSGSGSGSSRGG